MLLAVLHEADSLYDCEMIIILYQMLLLFVIIKIEDIILKGQQYKGEE